MRRALLVGIDGYPDAPLTTCSNDAKRLGEVLARNADQSTNWMTTVKLARQPDVTSILRLDLLGLLDDLFDARGEDVLFYFSGHALNTPWGPELSTQEGTQPGLGVPFSNLMAMVNTSKADSLTLILDCCFAGDLATALPGAPLGLGLYETATLRENVAILAAAADDQEVTAAQRYSTFTSLLLDGLLGGASDQRGRVTALSLYSHAWSAMIDGSAKPQLKANCAELPVLRTSDPWARLASFHKLIELFPTEDAKIVIEQSWLNPSVGDQPEALIVLTELNAARLVEFGSPHSIEWAARHQIPIRLNRPGRYYWRLVSRGLL